MLVLSVGSNAVQQLVQFCSVKGGSRPPGSAELVRQVQQKRRPQKVLQIRLKLMGSKPVANLRRLQKALQE